MVEPQRIAPALNAVYEIYGYRPLSTAAVNTYFRAAGIDSTDKFIRALAQWVEIESTLPAPVQLRQLVAKLGY